MDLANYDIPKAKLAQLHRAKIFTTEDLIRFWPRKYIDRSSLTGIQEKGAESVFCMRLDKVFLRDYSKSVLEAWGTTDGTTVEIKVVWFNKPYMFHEINQMRGSYVLVCGKAVYVENAPYKPYYQVVSPEVFTHYTPSDLKIYPKYKKVKGMSDEYLISLISDAFNWDPLTETLPKSILQKYNLLPAATMARELHNPTDDKMLESAMRRRNWDDLLYFAARIELNKRHSAAGSPYNLPDIRLMRKAQETLPFRLTEDQQATLESCIQYVRSGRRLNALIQGDVGCGKTVVAVLLMAAFAASGLQAVLMAPTQLLAQQHYEYLQSVLGPQGLTVRLVSGKKLRAKEQSALEKELAEGTCQIVVGTQALLSEKYKFKTLALIIEDEEHKYGVLQRKQLADKAAMGTHTIKMSATPIPRTLAQVIYGDDLQLYSIRTKPSGRKPTITGVARNQQAVFDFAANEIAHGHQLYVVCPMISANERVEGVASAEEVFKMYDDYFAPKGIAVAMVTGKTKKAEAEQIFANFEQNNISILVSTTVIEVGINVPNSTGIIIHNAERFGLAQLHQLRGRVGRGSTRGICVFVTEDRENMRLQAMCSSNDGFKIAELDLEQRGAGDLIGCEQSGFEHYLSLALTHPDDYAQAKEAAAYLLDNGESCKIAERAYQDFLAFGVET